MNTLQTGAASGRHEFRSRCVHWIGKGLLAVAENGAISGSNFVVNILLARWLQPAQYGAYALGFSVFLLLATTFQSIVTEPISILGPIYYHDRMPAYVGTLLRIHIGLSLIVMAVLGCAAFVVSVAAPQSGLGPALGGVGLAAPFVLLFWLTRAAAFVQFSARSLASAAVTYSALMLGGVTVLSVRSLLTPFTTFLAMLVAALGGSSILLFWLRPEPGTGVGCVPVRECWKRHWFFGRWEVASVGMDNLAQTLSYFITAATLSMGDIGALRAVINFGLPASQANSALRRVTQPYVSRISGTEGDSATRTPVRTMAWTLSAGAIPYFLLLIVFRHQIVLALYGGHFQSAANLIPLVCLSSGLSLAQHPFQVGLRAMQRPGALFAMNGTAGAISLALIVPAAWWFGVAGILWVSAVGNFVAFVIGVGLYHRRANEAASSSFARSESCIAG
jgi:O-antigen/teichoic acid export membrane protein